MRGGAWCGRLGWRLSVLPLVAALGVVPVAQAKDAAKQPSIWDQDTLTGDWGGARTALKDKGIDITLNYINEIFGVPSGGVDPAGELRRPLRVLRRCRSAEADRLDRRTDARHRLQHSQWRPHRRRQCRLASPIRATSTRCATTRLFTAWLQQNFAGDAVSLRIGQLAADDEFFISPTAGGSDQRHLRLGRHSRRQHDERRTGLSAGDAGRASGAQAE